jgi:UDP-N-acetylmuramate dehydrogenase
MPELENNKSLKAFNTFGINAHCKLFTVARNGDDIKAFIRDKALNNQPWLILGGGSNVLFTEDFNGLVIKNELKGIEIVEESSAHARLKIMSGEVWHQVVLFAVERGLGGIENLSLIPGTAGAAPMQNIGAYGVELEQVFESLEAINLETGEIENFNREQCRFGYRESIFKHEARGKYFILSITLDLKKKSILHTEYGAIQEVLKEEGISDPTIKDVSQAVISIRQSKLPNPTELGNAGSFFKNPEIEPSHYQKLKKDYPAMPGYEVENGKIKVPAGWLIEQCGWKGKRVGNTGSHARQALVLVNYGGASGKEIIRLARDIQASVHAKFGIDINPEVNIIGK